MVKLANSPGREGALTVMLVLLASSSLLQPTLTSAGELDVGLAADFRPEAVTRDRDECPILTDETVDPLALTLAMQ